MLEDPGKEGGREGEGGEIIGEVFFPLLPGGKGGLWAGSATIQVFDVREFVRNASFQCRNGVGWAHPDRAAVRLRLISLIASF